MRFCSNSAINSIAMLLDVCRSVCSTEGSCCVGVCTDVSELSRAVADAGREDGVEPDPRREGGLEELGSGEPEPCLEGGRDDRGESEPRWRLIVDAGDGDPRAEAEALLGD
mmetsp:Transcript_120292/g.187876  ORF Transcript_120292/g.187876 Transcript_120292/m.187876 type:complete len:111 (+) Transcript_120292:563-895(+)